MEDIRQSRLTSIATSAQEVVRENKSVHVGKVLQVNSGGTMLFATADNMSIEADDKIDIVCGASAIRLRSNGTVEITAKRISLKADQIDMT